MTNDHRLPHAHIINNKGRVRITLSSESERPIIIDAFDINNNDLKRTYKSSTPRKTSPYKCPLLT